MLRVAAASGPALSIFVAVVSFCSRVSCTRQDKSRHSDSELDLTEVEQEHQRHIEQSRAAYELRFWDRHDVPGRL